MRVLLMAGIFSLLLTSSFAQKPMKGWYLHVHTYKAYGKIEQKQIRFLRLGRLRFKLDNLTGFYSVKDTLLILKGKNGMYKDTLVISSKPMYTEKLLGSNPDAPPAKTATYLYHESKPFDFYYYDKRKWAKLKAAQINKQ